MRRMTPAPVLLLAALIAGCGRYGSAGPVAESGSSAPGPAPTTVASTAAAPEDPATTEEPATTEAAPPTRPPAGSPTAPAESPVLPDELVGEWTSASGDAALSFVFYANGTYVYVGLLQQERASGTFSYSISESGVAAVDGSALTLRPRKSTTSMTDPDLPSRSYRDRPAALTAKTMRWRGDGSTLEVTDETGLTVTYGRG
jgi:hypothetical protein